MWPFTRRVPKPTPSPSPPREPEPRIGSLRIVPVGTYGFGVERYVIKNEKSRHPYGSWERIHGHSVGIPLERAEALAREELLRKEADERNHRLHNETIMAHRKANPPRIVTLDTLK
jgi:hypothetical protein